MLLGAITPDEGSVTVLGYFANLHGVVNPAPVIDAGLERFRIPHLADAMASELSSGQRTLVGIIKATLHRPGGRCTSSAAAATSPGVRRTVWVA